MAELAGSSSDDRTPLILAVELEEEQDEEEKEEWLAGNGTVEADNTAASVLSPQAMRSEVLGREVVVCVFVVAFDTKRGNVVEWRYPEQSELEGVEFRALASGLHSINSDFIYFKHNQLYGLSCYEKISVDSVEERGARMRSVGILAVGYSDLHMHKEFLQEQARWQVNNPCTSYEALEKFFWRMQSPAQPHPNNTSLVQSTNMASSHPAGCFAQFLQFFGPQVFVLWRLALLKKRILMYTAPPIGAVCYRVYCMCLLSCHNLQQRIEEAVVINTATNPLFYINIADIDELTELDHFIACTTEQIFKTKPGLYDVYIDQQVINASSTRLDPLLKVSVTDQQRYNKLTAFIRSSSSMSGSVRSSSRADDNMLCARFFQRLNTELFQTLIDVSRTEDHVLTVDDVIRLGLDPVKDRVFLTELVQEHSVPVTVQRQQDVFSCCI